MSTPTTNQPPPQPAGTATPGQLAAAQEAEVRLAALMRLGDVNQANAATGIYGDSGTGKSTLAATGGEYGWQRYHRITRYYTADPGGFGNKLIRLIRLGIVQVYNPTNHAEPFETMENISKGWWPETILDPYTGYAEPDVRLIPPQRTEFRIYCPNGHVVRRTETKKTLNNFSLQCPTCKVITTAQNWSKVEEVVIRAAGAEHVGLYVYDSGTALCDHAMEDMAGRAAASDPNVKDGNALSGTGARIISGAYAFGANTQQHYGFSQNRIRQWIKNSRLIPGQVVPPIWTFLVQRATDDNTNMAIFGPKISGNAKTPEVPSWLGNCIHTEIVTNEKNERKHRMWLVNHFQPGTVVPYLAKTRSEPGDLPPFIEDQPDEPIFTRFSLGYFFNQLEAALDKHAEQDIRDFPDAPAFAPLAIGEPVVVSSKDLNTEGLGATVGRAAVTAGGVGAAAAAVARPAAAVAPVAGRPAVAPAAVAATKPQAHASTQVAKPATPATQTAATLAPAPVPVSAPAPVAVTPAPQPARPVQASAPAASVPAAGSPSPTPRVAGASAPAGKATAPGLQPAPAQAQQVVPATVPAPVQAQAQPGGRPPTPPAVARRSAPPPVGKPPEPKTN